MNICKPCPICCGAGIQRLPIYHNDYEIVKCDKCCGSGLVSYPLDQRDRKEPFPLAKD